MIKALYVHVPFCHSICAYCDYTRVLAHPKLIDEYLNALENEISILDLSMIDTIYFGGGTPSALNETELQHLLEILKPYSNHLIEYTIEINPESLNQAKAKMMHDYGINRISLGVQSFQVDELKLMHRQHSLNDIKSSIDLLHYNHLSNISIDLIYGLPYQTLDKWQDTLNQAMTLDITHISLYSLTIEPNSEFKRLNLKGVEEELEEDMYFSAIEILNQHDFKQYEISNFTRLNPSAHNIHYWHYDDYAGVGPGAVSLINHTRIENSRSILDYNLKKAVPTITPLSLKDEMDEFVLMGLRLKEGLRPLEFSQRYHHNIKEVYPKIDTLVLKGLLIEDEFYLACSEKGFPLLLSVLGEMFED